MSKDATRMYSTWFSASPRGYCERNFLLGCASGLYLRGADREECSDETLLDGVFELTLELGSERRWLVSRGGSVEGNTIFGGVAAGGKEERDVLRLMELLCELEVPLVEGRAVRYIGGSGSADAIFTKILASGGRQVLESMDLISVLWRSDCHASMSWHVEPVRKRGAVTMLCWATRP